MDDLLAELGAYILGPFIILLLIVGLISMGVSKCSHKEESKPIIQKIEVVEAPKESLSHRAGHKSKEVVEDFIKGFFSK